MTDETTVVRSSAQVATKISLSSSAVGQMILTAREWAPNSKVGADFGEDASRCRRWPETVPIMKFVLRWLTNATHDGRFANCSFGIPEDKLSYKKIISHCSDRREVVSKNTYLRPVLACANPTLSHAHPQSKRPSHRSVPGGSQR